MAFGFLKTKVHSTRHYVIVMAFAVVLIFMVGNFFVASRIEYINNSNSNKQMVESPFARSNPTQLIIPSLGIDTTFVLPLALLPDQTVAVPDSYTQVGWYEGGATPGEIGPAVILGHVDSKEGPAVFYPLGQLKVGEEIEVTRADGTKVLFVVTKLQRYPQSNFPTLDVYGPTTIPTLRLVTCTGTFDKGEQRYSHNLVVYAELKQ
jgi:sortase (surface protein transpeptidase)